VAQVLDTLPATLDETYTRMLLDIEDMYHNHAITLLQWLAYARSPPTLAELVEVAITDPIRNDSWIDVDNRGGLEDTLNILSGLVTIEGGGDAKVEKHWKKGSIVDDISTADYDQGNAILQGRMLISNAKVRLAHFSVMEFLESQRILEGKARQFHLDSARGHDFVMRSCLTYISHYSTSHERTSSELDLGEFPLLMYAVKSWFHHSAMRKGNNAAFETTFLRNPTARNAWLSVHCPDEPLRGPFRDIRLLGSDLYYASLLGLPLVVDGLLKSRTDVNAEGGRYGNALQAASYGGHLRVMRQLLDNGADANALGGQYGNALQAASYAGHIETARLLLNEGADVNVQNGHFGSALQAATYNRHVEMMHLLLEHDAHLCAFALIEILTKRQLDMVTHLVPYLKSECMTHGDQVHSKTLLHWAAEVGSKAVTTQSLFLGANVHAQDRYGETALHYAAGEGHLEIVKSLVSAGATLDALNARAQTPLFCAQNHGPRLGSRSHQMVAQYLMSNLASKGKSINRHNANAFIDASLKGRTTTLQQLLDQGADVNVQGGQFGNALQAASRGGHIEAAQLLLDKGADVNAQGGHFGNALQAAICGGHIETARLLLEKGADVNIQGGYHGNALQAAARGGHIEVTQLLLDKGADVRVQGGLYGYALHAASEGGHLEISLLLLTKGADVNAQGGQFGNALQAASIGGHIETAQLLLDKGADVNAQGGLYGSALQAASRGGYIKMARLLLNKGADVNAQGGLYSNALQAALTEGHAGVVQSLQAAGARDLPVNDDR
jgi:ankyrin repeat protein